MKVVIPAPIFIGVNSSRVTEGRQSERSERAHPVLEMVLDFRRDDVWMPDQVRHDGKGSFINRF
jgi:hypothetical protein